MLEENAVSLKLPLFWAMEPQIWFTQAEAQFALRKLVSNNTKYYCILSSLDQTTASQLNNFISNIQAKDKYDTLKDQLLETFKLSKPKCPSLLLHFRPLGDTRRSALMDEMLALLRDHRPYLLFQQLFLEWLPEDMLSQLIDKDIEGH